MWKKEHKKYASLENNKERIANWDVSILNVGYKASTDHLILFYTYLIIANLAYGYKNNAEREHIIDFKC